MSVDNSSQGNLAGGGRMSAQLPHATPAVPLLERRFEVSVLTDSIEKGNGGNGQYVLVEGSSGIGKTRLLEASGSIAAERGAQVFATCGGELERDYPFGLVRRLLESEIARSSPERRSSIFRGHAQVAESLLGSAPSDGGSVLADEFLLIHSLYWLIVNLADDAPLVLIADDMQWGDDMSLRFLLYLSQRINDLPITIVGAVRTGDPAAENDLITRLMLQANVTLRPAELSAAAAKLMLNALVPGIADNARAVAESWSATRGNPFLLRELATAIKSQTGDEGLGPADEFVARTVPVSVTRSIMLRLNRLGSHATALARAVAVLGTSTSITTAGELCQMDFATATSAADQLRTAQIFSAAGELGFYHPMIRTAVYNDYPSHQRAEAHLAAALELHNAGVDDEQVALHLMRGAPTDAEWAIAALHSAARGAGRKGAPASGVSYLRRALAMSSHDSSRTAGLLVDLGVLEAATGEKTSLSHLEKALELMQEPEEKARAMYALGQTHFRYGRANEALTVFRRGADAFEVADRNRALQFEAGYMASASYLIDHVTEAKVRAEHLAAAIADPADMSPAERLLMLHLAVFKAMTEPPAPAHADLALTALGDGLKLWRQTSDAMTISHVVMALTWCGRAREAAHLADPVLIEARRRGDSLIFAEISLARSMAMYARGKVNDAMADAQAAIVGMKRGWNSTVPAPQGILAYCLLDRGEFDEAAAVLDDAATALRGGETRLLNVWFYMARGRLRLHLGDALDALDDFTEVGSLLDTNNYLNPGFMLVPWRSHAGLAQHALGHMSEAVELITRDVELAREFCLPAVLVPALRALAMVSPGGPDIPLLEESAAAHAAAGDNGSPVELARTLLELGAALRRGGLRLRSRDPLRRALDLAHHAGALHVEHRAHEELLASGARPRRAVISGADALTPGEQRIAALMSKGLTSRSIAESLYLTTSTVEWHRRNIYRKLDVTSRDELRVAMEGRRAAAVDDEHRADLNQ